MCPDRGQMQTLWKSHFLSVRLYKETSFFVRIEVLCKAASFFANEILSIEVGRLNGVNRKNVTL